MMQERIVQMAKKYVGQREMKNNSGFKDKDFEKRMKDVGWQDGQAWCSYFAELVWREAYKITTYDKELAKLFSGSATQTYKNFQLSGNWEFGATPREGALAVWRYGVGWQGHIGIVYALDEKDPLKFLTIEGNTNQAGGREGIEVAKKIRFLNKPLTTSGLNLVGFIYPKE